MDHVCVGLVFARKYSSKFIIKITKERVATGKERMLCWYR